MELVSSSDPGKFKHCWVELKGEEVTLTGKSFFSIVNLINQTTFFGRDCTPEFIKERETDKINIEKKNVQFV